jgi:hypothetical protein
MNESFLKMQKLAGVISDTEYNEIINEGIFDRVKAKVKGGAAENQVEESLDSAKHYWPIPPKWFNKYYTMDFYEEGPRIFRNDNGEHASFSDVIKHYESEEGSTNSLW